MSDIAGRRRTLSDCCGRHRRPVSLAHAPKLTPAAAAAVATTPGRGTSLYIDTMFEVALHPDNIDDTMMSSAMDSLELATSERLIDEVEANGTVAKALALVSGVPSFLVARTFPFSNLFPPFQ